MLERQKLISDDSRLLALLDHYAGYVARAGKPVRRASVAAAQKMLRAIDGVQRNRLASRLETEIAIFDEVLAAGEKLTDSSRILWRLFSKSGQTPCSDLFGRIEDGDVVEVYGPDQRHVFQNFNFYDYVSCTLETVFCETWYQATRRDREIEALIHGAALKVFSGELTETFDPRIPVHVFEELETELLFKIEHRMKWISPVFADRRLSGLIAVSACKVIASKRPNWIGT